MKIEHTSRGFEVIYFKDYYGSRCSLQQSSLALFTQPGSSAIWLGADESRMHLVKPQVEELIKHLQAWVETGSLDADESK